MADESRIENILDATLGEPGAEVPSPPFSRIEEKLIELKEAIESGGGGGGGTTNYNALTNKPSINGHTLQGNSTLDTLGIASKSTLDAAIEELELMETEIDGKVDKESGKGLSTNDFTNADKTDLSTALTKANAAAPQSTTYTKTEVDTVLAAKLNTADVDTALSSTSTNPVQNKVVKLALDSKADATDIPAVPITAIQKNGTGITPVSGTVNITVPTTAADISALPDTTKYAAALSLTINSSTFVMTGQLKDQNGDNLGAAQTIDLPLESVVVGGAYDSQTKKVVLTLQNGNTIEFSVADLVSGLQTELSASNKLNPAYINYDSTHRAVSDAEKSTWNGKQDSLTTAQLAAVNSGITAARLETIDTTLSDKVDKETGKGLSTNDFTDTDKANLTTALTKANAAAPQSTTYTKTEVDTALAAKLNTTDVDAALSGTSTNPVQNKVVHAPIARLADAGAKNLLKITATTQTITGVTFTVNADQTVTVNGTNTGTGAVTFILVPIQQAILIPDGDYWLLGCPQGGSSDTFDLRWYRYSPNASAYDMGSGAAIHKSGNTADSNIAIVVKSGVTVNNITFKPMLCTGADYAISPEFVPYTPTMRELYEMILALQNGG